MIVVSGEVSMVYSDQQTYKDRNGYGQGTQVIDRKVQHLGAKGAWKYLQDNTREVQCDFEDIPISIGLT
jgi:transposase